VLSARLDNFRASSLYTPAWRARGLGVARERAVSGRRADEQAGRGEREIGCVSSICIEGAFEPGKQAKSAISRAEKARKTCHFLAWFNPR